MLASKQVVKTFTCGSITVNVRVTRDYVLEKDILNIELKNFDNENNTVDLLSKKINLLTEALREIQGVSRGNGACCQGQGSCGCDSKCDC